MSTRAHVHSPIAKRVRNHLFHVVVVSFIASAFATVKLGCCLAATWTWILAIIKLVATVQYSSYCTSIAKNTHTLSVHVPLHW